MKRIGLALGIVWFFAAFVDIISTFRLLAFPSCLRDDISLNITLWNNVRLDKCSENDPMQTVTFEDFEKEPKAISYAYAKKDKQYTLVMFYQSYKKLANVLEWIVCNISGEDLQNGDVNYLNEILEYERGQLEDETTGIHQFVVYEQSGKDQTVSSPDTRDNFGLIRFENQKRNVLNEDVAFLFAIVH